MPDAGRNDRFTRQKAVRRAAMGLIFAAAGLGWLAFARLYTAVAIGRTIGYAGVAAAVAVIAFLVLLQRSQRLAPAHTTAAQDARVRRIVVAINILEWVAVATAVSVLLLLHLQDYILTACGIIVGLYLYPIAGALRAPLHTITATLLVSWNVIALALLPRSRQMSLGAEGTAAVLLCSAAVTLGWALWRTRRVSALPGALPVHDPADSLTR